MNKEETPVLNGSTLTSEDSVRLTRGLLDMSTEGSNVNDALVQVGAVGKYQLYMLFWGCLCGALTSMQSLVMVFTQAEMDFRCLDFEEEDLNYITLAGNGSKSNQSSYGVCQYANKTLECSSFTFNSSVYQSTVVSEFELVCSRSIWNTVTNMLFMLARIPGGLLVGQIIDRIGRKKTIVVGLFLLGAVGFGTAYSVNIAMYIVFRALAAIPIMAVYDSVATFISEVTTAHQRPHILIGLIYSWGSGICLLSLFGYFIRDWRTLHMAISVPSFAMCLVAFWVFDESPHWLYSQNRCKEAQAILEKIASWNGCSHKLTVILHAETGSHSLSSKLDDEPNSEKLGTQSDLDSVTPEKSQCMQILSNRKFLIVLGICAFGWLACNMGYAGLALGLGSLSGDTYIINLIGGCTEFVSFFIAFLVIPCGRKLVYIGLLVAGGLGLIAAAVIQDLLPNMNWLVIATTMVGRLSVSAGWQIMYLWCIELFPTTIRWTTLEVSQWVGHIGSTAAPFINDLTKVIKNPSIRGKIIAPAVYGTLLLISSILAIFLPETNNKPLPVNLEEATSNITSAREKETNFTTRL